LSQETDSRSQIRHPQLSDLQRR